MKLKTPNLARGVIIIMLIFLFGCGDSEVESEDSYTDETPPAIISISPEDGSGALAGTAIVVTFSEAMDGTSISANTENTDCSGSIQVSNDDFSTCVQMDSHPIPNEEETTFTLQPANKLERDQTYKIKITITARDTGQNSLIFDQVSNQGFITLYVEEISTGSFHLCVTLNDQSLYCWGNNLYGGLGTGEKDYMFYSEPVKVSLFDDVSAVYTMFYQTCVLNTENQIHCVGNGYSGFFGTPMEYTLDPVLLEMLGPVLKIDSELLFHCVIEEGGDVKCWGENWYGQLGNGSFEYTPQYEPTSVLSLDNATELSVGAGHSCAITSDQTIKCWGNGGNGRLGNDSTSDQSSAVLVSNIDNAVKLAVGGAHTCALLSDKTIECWGYGGYGGLGNDSTSDQLSPVPVQNISTATQLTAGDGHTCALLEEQSIECWGRNYYGQIGNDSTADQLTPTTVYNINKAIAISAGESYTCAILSDRSVKCWGNNRYESLGRRITTDSLIPFEVPGL